MANEIMKTNSMYLIPCVGTYLPKLIAACDKDQPIEIRSKALPSLQLLTRKGVFYRPNWRVRN